MTQAWTLGESIIVNWDYGNTCSLKNNSSTNIMFQISELGKFVPRQLMTCEISYVIVFHYQLFDADLKTKIIYRQLRSWGSLMSESNSSLIISSRYKNSMIFFPPPLIPRWNFIYHSNSSPVIWRRLENDTNRLS